MIKVCKRADGQIFPFSEARAAKPNFTVIDVETPGEKAAREAAAAVPPAPTLANSSQAIAEGIEREALAEVAEAAKAPKPASKAAAK